MRALVVALVCLGAVAHADAPTAKKKQKWPYSHKSMGTIVNVTIYTDDEAGAAKGAKAVFDEIDRLDDLMTTWRDSEIYRINENAGKKPVKVSDESILVIDRALDVSAKSNGIFDITVGAFHGLWKFDEDMDGSLPDPAEVKKRLSLVNWKDVIVDHKKKTVFLKREGMSITLGGIAKGYAVDRGVAILKKLGFTSFIVQAGGDLYVAGDKDGDPWIVAIRDPRGPYDSSFAIAPIKDHSFSTSGDYERGFVKDGVRYHHILDPRDGQPARASRSVTVMAKDAFTADAWSKVLFILGADGAMDLVEKMPDFDAAWVDSKNQVHVSSELKPILKILRQPTDAP